MTDWDAEAEAMDRACRHGGSEWDDTGPCLVCIAALARRAEREGLERALRTAALYFTPAAIEDAIRREVEG